MTSGAPTEREKWKYPAPSVTKATAGKEADNTGGFTQKPPTTLESRVPTDLYRSFGYDGHSPADR
jgi:hypothetical protein